MDWITVILRIIHIVSGVVWVGGAALFFFYIEPTLNKFGADAEKVIDELVSRRRLPIYFIAFSTLNVLAGTILYWRNFEGIGTSPYALALGIGGLAAIAAWLGGALLIPRAISRVGSIGAEMKATGGPPSADLFARMHAAQAHLRTLGGIDLGLLTFAVIAMASARYLG